MMNSEFWRHLHDGVVQSISGQIPGEVSIQLSIRYLRDQFPGGGSGFRIDLRNCRQLVYQEYDANAVTGFAEIVALAPSIVDFSKVEDTVVVNCVMGSLTMIYDHVSVFLDSGEAVPFKQLASASKSYWDAWAERTRHIDPAA
jgi:hypothetical protein